MPIPRLPKTLVMPLQNGTQKEPEREVWAPTFVAMMAEVAMTVRVRMTAGSR